MKRKASISEKTQVEESIPVFPRHLEDRHLRAHNPKYTGQDGTALTRCTARRTAISSESSVADSHHHNRERASCFPTSPQSISDALEIQRFSDLTTSEEREKCLQTTTGSLTPVGDAQVPILKGRRRIDLPDCDERRQNDPLQTEAI
ncbi:hypothetical protein IGI04_030371 [Brassica rapa subsp. trilocularis]|uniref:DUF4005 domain-containing protein n=1 Tax=Brassica rapa subsp. trilocularis TaxID=1813537 RepID=A0ABQ7LQI0_BRACM|nr:hypothetical protein IGI04_030371 [Brassica rapa subsp. trilocularis]